MVFRKCWYRSCWIRVEFLKWAVPFLYPWPNQLCQSSRSSLQDNPNPSPMTSFWLIESEWNQSGIRIRDKWYLTSLWWITACKNYSMTNGKIPWGNHLGTHSLLMREFVTSRGATKETFNSRPKSPQLI